APETATGPQVSAQHPQPRYPKEGHSGEEVEEAPTERSGGSQAHYSLQDSWLSRYVELSREYAKDAPESYHIACGLALLSVASVHYVKLSSNYFPVFNPVIFVLLMGPSVKGKSRTMKVAHTVLQKADIGIGVIVSFTP